MKAIIRYLHTGSYIFPCAAMLQTRDHQYSTIQATWKDARAAVVAKAKEVEALWEVPPEEEVEI